MADYDRRNGGPRGSYNNRKRRHRGSCSCYITSLSKLTLGADDDEVDRRQQRRRYEEPLHIKVRKQLLGVAESVRFDPSFATALQAKISVAIKEDGGGNQQHRKAYCGQPRRSRDQGAIPKSCYTIVRLSGASTLGCR